MTPTITMTACAVLLFIAVAYLYLENRSLRQKVKELEDEYDKECGKRLELSFNVSSIPQRTAEAWSDIRNHCYEVYVKADDNFFTLRRYTYDPSDSDDRKYKRVHAQEVADLLNEKP